MPLRPVPPRHQLMFGCRQLGEQLEQLRTQLGREQEQRGEDGSSPVIGGFLACKFRNYGCDFAVPSVRDHEAHSCR